MIRKAAIVAAMAWTLGVTCLRAARLPNNFSTEHWLIDYRFGFVKRGLVGSVLSIATRLAGTRPSERLIDILAIVMFVIFCAALLCVSVLMVRRWRWSTDIALSALVFLSSPFIVMSAHLIGYYDNIVILMTVVSLALVFERRMWPAAAVQAVAILVHENALLVGFPVFCCGAWLATRRAERRRRDLLPLLLPIAAFLLIAVRLNTAPHRLERSLTAYLSTYPFVAGTIADVRVPHWITITFNDSYLLHQGHLQERILSQPMIALVLPSLLALLGVLFESQGLALISWESAIALAVCLLPQAMHVMVWDTARIWTYSIVCTFLLLWVTAALRPARRTAAPFVVLLSLVALLVNVIGVTPLMDGLRERFDVTTRLLMYAPVLALAVALACSARPSGERQPLG